MALERFPQYNLNSGFNLQGHMISRLGLGEERDMEHRVRSDDELIFSLFVGRTSFWG